MLEITASKLEVPILQVPQMYQYQPQQQMPPQMEQRRTSIRSFRRPRANVEVCVSDDKTDYSYISFDVNRLIFGGINTSELPSTLGTKGTYQTVSVSYNYGTDVEDIRPFKLEGPEEMSSYCLSSITDDTTGKVSYSILSQINKKREDHARYSEVLHQIYYAICRYMLQHADELGINTMGITADSLAQFTMERPSPWVGWPIRYPNIKNTKRPDVSKLPIVNHKVTLGRKPTIFTTDAEHPKTVSPEILQACDFKFVALDDMSSIYIGTGPKAFLQIKTESAIIRDIIPRNNTTNQGRTLKLLAQSQDNRSSELEKKIEQIRSQLEDPNSKVDTTTTASSAPANPANLLGAIQAQQQNPNLQDRQYQHGPPNIQNQFQNSGHSSATLGTQGSFSSMAPLPSLPASFGGKSQEFQLQSSQLSSYNDHNIPPKSSTTPQQSQPQFQQFSNNQQQNQWAGNLNLQSGNNYRTPQQNSIPRVGGF